MKKNIDIHTQELIDRINGLSDDEKIIVAEHLELSLLFAVGVKRALRNEKMLMNLKEAINEQSSV